MLYGLLVTVYVIICCFLVFLVLIQKSKGSAGLSGFYGGSGQQVFGGSGGQDILQKITWVLGAIFMAGSFGLAMMKSKQHHTLRYMTTIKTPAKQGMPPSQR